ncbi:MAG TPA: polynucleotide adenylyltransferase PcnB [Candidatus Eisenbacteria bacterium]|nr:polynucleotide adenylyltransferase PcnB [Candidatus Eisenbacteria bacterium]
MEPAIIPRAQHAISRKLIDQDALRVMYRLLRAGHHAYLVGGAVRDLLLGRTPKDFDVGTDAHPHQIKRLFRNCRIVGRRFRLAHIHFEDKIIEVSTFRRHSEYLSEGDGDRLIRSDNTFGTPEEDAIRRDFTINGLFYDLDTFSVLDFVGGMKDLDQRVVRSIGNAGERIPEDPVRILRAIKFAARLGFTIEPALWDAMVRFSPDIHKCAQARVLEEIYRLLRGGAAGASFQLMEECGLLRELLPEMQQFLVGARAGGVEGDRVFWEYLQAVDESVQSGGQPGNALLFGAIGAPLMGLAPGQDPSGERSPAQLARDIESTTRGWVERLGMARRDRERLAHMLRAQPRLMRPRGRRFRPRAFVAKHYYPDAEALFALGCRATGLEADTLERWRLLHREMGTDQNNVISERWMKSEADGRPEDASMRRRRGRRRRRRRRKSSPAP